MVNSVQPVSIGTPALNKIGFAAEKAPEATQPQVSLETPKDEFKKSHAVRNGALIGAAAGLGVTTASIVELKKLGSTQSISELLKQNKTRAGTWFAGLTAVGAGIGAVVKHFGKKESPKDEVVAEKSHAVRNGALAGAATGLALIGKSVYTMKKTTGKSPKLMAVSLVAAPFAMAGSAVGATIGKIVKMVSKKD